MFFFTFFSDVDECLQDPCHDHAHCSNTAGAYSCQCLPGFQGDGFYCTIAGSEHQQTFFNTFLQYKNRTYCFFKPSLMQILNSQKVEFYIYLESRTVQLVSI